MKKILLILSLAISSFASQSQLLQPQVISALDNYFFVPVMFDNLGEWVKEIDNDSAIIFKEKTFSLVDDSLHMHYELEKPGYPLGYKNARSKLIIMAQTRKVNYLNLTEDTIQIKKFTNMNLSLIISFDGSENGKQLAAQLQNDLDDSIRQFFKKRRAYVGNKKLRAPNHPGIYVHKCIHYYQDDNVIATFTISNTVKVNENRLALYLDYALNN